ncbi:MAG: tRNA lysidine(34) synthetase TilS [Erythrobacter sp.]
MWPEGERLALAVSGGPDSLALLMLAHALRPGMVEAATVDHGLRPEAAAEAQMVADLCAELDVPHAVLRVEVPPGNLQSMARQTRYSALAKWMGRGNNGQGITLLATAHHADDQAETLLMRLNRGSGLSGLAGVRRAGRIPGADYPLIRPLLGWRKAELAALLVDLGIEPVQDPSNHDDAFDRVRLRKALASSDWLDSEAIAQSASHLADADEVLDWAVAREWDECVSATDDQISYAPRAPRAVRLKVLARAIGLLESEPRGGAVAKLLTALENGQGGNLAGVLATIRGETEGGLEETSDDDPAQAKWIFRREPHRSQL